MGSQGLTALDVPADDRKPSAPGARKARKKDAFSIRRLTLTDFRCYRQQRIETDQRPVVLTGANGAGKTNVLEGLSFLVPGRGLRRARLADLIRRENGADTAPSSPHARPWGVAASVVTPQGTVEIGTGYQAGASGSRDKRVVHVDGEVVKSQAVLAQHLSCQWLTPQMDRLFVDGPGSRRRFLDRLVSNFDPAHLGRVNAYEHAMRERVRLLRTAAADGDWLTTLEDTMATKGVAVAAARIDVICRLSVQLAGETGAFPCATAGVEGAVEGWLAEEPALAAEDRFRDALMSGRAQDATDGRAAIGPHKSNLKVHHLGNGRPAELCSTGEQKALLIALVLGIARLRACEQGAPPLLLLDEVAAHLDDFCRDALFDEISGLGAQVWLTGTDTGLFGGLAGRAQFFNVADGKVTPRDEA